MKYIMLLFVWPLVLWHKAQTWWNILRTARLRREAAKMEASTPKTGNYEAHLLRSKGTTH